jgi:hypothetical protein
LKLLAEPAFLEFACLSLVKLEIRYFEEVPPEGVDDRKTYVVLLKQLAMAISL